MLAHSSAFTFSMQRQLHLLSPSELPASINSKLSQLSNEYGCEQKKNHIIISSD